MIWKQAVLEKTLESSAICLHFCSISVNDGRFIIQKRPILTAAQLAKIVEIREIICIENTKSTKLSLS